MEVSYLDFMDWVLSSSYTEATINFQDTISTTGTGDNLIINSHLNTILNVWIPSGSWESGSYGYGTDHYERTDITNEVITAYSSSL